MICYLFSEPIYLLYSLDVPALFYYAQIPATVLALLLGFYLFRMGKEYLLNRILFILSLLFSFWVVMNLITWTSVHSNLILFTWSFFNLIIGLISVFSIYFIYVFLTKKDVSFKIKIFFMLFLFPILVLGPTYLNLSGFDITNCDAFNFEGIHLRIYSTLLGFLAIAWILVLLIRHYRIATTNFKKQIILMGTGIELFLFSFFGMEFLGSYLTRIGILQDSQLELYGLFGMVIFMIYVSILVVRFNVFSVKLIATQALVWGLVILVGSQFFFIKVTTNFILNGVTFVGAIIFGQLLIKSVKREIEQKEELAKLNIDLERLIKQKESLMHLINHKVKGAFTHTKYIFAELLDGTYGEINEDIKRVARMGLESDETGVMTIDLILNASNLQNGVVKYDMKPVDARDIINGTLEEKKKLAEKKGLKMEQDITGDSCMVNGDVFWLKEVVNNLLENSIRYTREGRIDVNLKKDNGKMLFSIKDTGVGITEEDKVNLFTEGGRGKESVSINVDSTGYGLFTVKMIVEAHGGKVWVESEGKNKGSTFFVELNTI
jgi:signal transduction histidine kinase